MLTLYSAWRLGQRSSRYLRTLCNRMGDVKGKDGNEVYDWLKKNAPGLGFVRTVNREPWHWEYDPPRAAKAVQNQTFKIPTVTQ